LPAPTEVVRRGIAYEATSGGAALWLDHLHESREELSGELTVKLDQRHISRARFNLSSLTARNAQAKYLTDTGGRMVPWRAVLEEFCLGVLDLHRQGQPVFRLNGQYEHLPPEPEVMPPLLSFKDPTILYGEGGCGKSTLATAAALSIVTGVELIPGMPVRLPGRVVVLDWEDKEGAWGRRLHAFARAAGIPTEEVIYQRQQRPLKDSIERVAALCAAEGADLVIVDSVTRAIGSGGEHQSAESGTVQLFEALAILDCTTLLIDHVVGAAMGTERAVVRPYGSVVKFNLARSMFEMRREAEPVGGRSEVMLINHKLNNGPKVKSAGLAMVYDESGIRIEKAEITAPEMQASRSLPERMAAVLRTGARTTTEVANELDIKPNAVRAIVSRDTRFRRIGDKLVGLSATSAT
jgi:hypothetical protein